METGEALLDAEPIVLDVQRSALSQRCLVNAPFQSPWRTLLEHSETLSPAYQCHSRRVGFHPGVHSL